MLNTKHILTIFIPAILIAGLALFIEVVQYRPLFPKLPEEEQTSETPTLLPILPGDPIIGNKAAAKTIVVFEDFSCEGCKQQDYFLSEIEREYPGKIKVIWKGLPVARFPHNARLAHQYAYCANLQGKFVTFKDFAYANNESLSDTMLQEIATQIELDQELLTTCLNNVATETHIVNTEALAMSVNVQAVPAIFIDNKQITPPQSLAGWKTVLGL